MAENPIQYRWIVLIREAIALLFRRDTRVFVAADLFWYPIEGDFTTRLAPDVMVAFGPLKGDRGSYKQWLEGHIAPQVVFEILAPGNTALEMLLKLDFYERFGVEEYYLYDPAARELRGWQRRIWIDEARPSRAGAPLVSTYLAEIEVLSGWVSPRLGVRFELANEEELQLFGPDGQRFVSYEELADQCQQARVLAAQAHQEREQAQAQIAQERQEREQAQAQIAQKRQEREQAQAQIAQKRQEREQAQSQIAQEHQRAERLAARLRELGINPDDL